MSERFLVSIPRLSYFRLCREVGSSVGRYGSSCDAVLTGATVCVGAGMRGSGDAERAARVTGGGW